jgi:hypothetical protein
MALLRSTLELPMFSEEQVLMIRAIAHVAQIAESVKILQSSYEILNVTISLSEKAREARLDLEKFLTAEASRVLTQVKIPKLVP